MSQSTSVDTYAHTTYNYLQPVSDIEHFLTINIAWLNMHIYNHTTIISVITIYTFMSNGCFYYNVSNQSALE